MTSARTCYCKQEGCVLREVDNDTGVRSENRRPIATVASKKSTVKPSSSARSSERARSIVVGERKPDASGSIEARACDPVLSPETSTALENAERIINDAKIQLAEVRVVSSFDSARRDRDRDVDDPPLDDDVEELLYIRELVASKFQETGYPERPEATTDEENARRVTSRRVDLSAPKFRTLQRLRATSRASLERGTDEQRSRGRASLSGASKVSSSKDDEEATAHDCQTTCNGQRVSSATRFGLIRADDGGACRIQIGPTVHVSRELTRQDLEDVHISPGPSPARKRVNAAVYVLRHESNAEGSQAAADNRRNEPSRVRRRARLGTSSREKRERLIVTETVVETASASRKLGEDIRVVVDDKDSDYEQRNEFAEASTSPAQNSVHEEERRAEEVCLQDAENAKTLKSPESLTDEEKETSDKVPVESPEPVNVLQVEVSSGNNAEHHCTGKSTGEIFSKKNGVDSPARPQNEENVVDKIPAKNRDDQSRPPLASVDVSRQTSFLRRENIARLCRTTTSLKQYRTIDEYLSNTFNSHGGPDEPCDVAEEIRRSHLSSDDFQAKDDANEIELYRPRFDELDSIILSNEKKIERAIRVAQTFSELLSKPQFTRYKLEEGGRESRHVGCQKPSIVESPADRDHKLAKLTSSPVNSFDTTPKNQVLSASSTSETRSVSGVGSQKTFAAATTTRSSSFARRDVLRRDDRSGNSPGSTDRRTPTISDGSRMSRNAEDESQRPKRKARLLESSIDKSDVTTFSNLLPALSSTHCTDTQTNHPQQEQIEIAQAQRSTSEDRYAVANRSENPANKIADQQMNERHNINDVFVRILRGLQDETTDRFVAYILQDEKHSIEGKIAKALNVSAITPTMVEKLLVLLQEADPVSDGATRRTETSNVLKDILISVKNRTNEVVEDDEDGEVAKEDMSKTSSRSELLKRISDILSDEAANSKENSRLSSARTISTRSQVNHETKADGPDTLSTIQDKESNTNDERRKFKFDEVRDDKAENPKENSRLSSARTISMKSQTNHDTKADDPDTLSAIQNKESDTNDEECKFKSDEARDDKDPVLSDQVTKGSVAQATPDRASEALLNVPSDILVTVKEKGNKEKDEKKSTAEEITNDSTSLKTKKISTPISDASVKKDEQTRSGMDRSRIVDETLAKKDLARSLIEPPCPLSEKDIDNSRARPVVVENDRISPANSCSADSLRDCISLRSLSSAQSNESPSKETQLRGKRTSLDAVTEDNSTETSNKVVDVRGEPVTNGTVKNLQNRNEDSTLPGSARDGSNKEQFFERKPIASISLKSLSSSGSNTSSTILNHNSESNNGTFSDNTKRLAISSEMSHSEGELYMPSSCSYSLGEVRILEKDDLIADSTIEHDSSVTILVTRSMLTSLNDSSTTPESIAHILI
ncbi:uncharacterized protein LOC105181093 [Harpegnathos saltator]|uniref:uncharacterized protein LOC105181093 n=1 Tax=Harpegnathos saltator TaxID=610380 RepID=UPI00058B77AE|nr:uncharacterized protein LOC105181093 [Harpegnathos saltator]